MIFGPDMATKQVRKPDSGRSEKDREEYKRFLETARAVGASDDPKDFDKAFRKVITATPKVSSKGDS
jgi:hypothetical protein